MQMEHAQQFVEELAKLQFANVFNPYADVCHEWDTSEAPAIRRRNLQLVLGAAMASGVESIWFARDLGYRGGRRTGLALTDEMHLENYATMLGTSPLRRATKGPAVGERTAATIWQVLRVVNRPVFLWNVFPLHPHNPGDPMSNRSHTRPERQTCEPLSGWLLEKLRPKRVVAIGRDAYLALKSIDGAVTALRHPSYGGHTEFTQGIESLYGVSLGKGKCNSQSRLL